MTASNGKLRILLVNPSLAVGGAERVVCNLASEFYKSPGVSAEILIVTKLIEGASEMVPPPELPIKKLGHRRILSSVPSIFRTLLTGKFDIVVSNQRHLNIPVSFIFFLLRIFGAKCGKLIVVEHETPLFISSKKISFKNSLLEAISPLIYRSASAIICPTQGHSDALKSKWPSLSAKIHAIANPVLPSPPRPPQEKHIRDKNLVLVVGRLVPIKDVSLAISAFAIASKKQSLRMQIVGDGPEMPLLKDQVKNLGITDKVEFAGSVKDPSLYFLNAAILLVTSLSEAFGNVLVEAMAAGCMVVSVDCPYGPREILAAGKFGTLIPSRDAGDIAEGILFGIQNPISESILIAEAGRFTSGAAAEAYLTKIQDILS
jgi:glycosyltransferase involved in cell wall biosynthesis